MGVRLFAPGGRGFVQPIEGSWGDFSLKGGSFRCGVGKSGLNWGFCITEGKGG